MSDPYLNFDEDNILSDIQVNVFRVRGPLKGISDKNYEERRDRILHGDVTIFNPGNRLKPSMGDIKISKSKIVDKQIYLSDTIEVLLNKIALNCCTDEDITGKDIYAWIDENKKSNASLSSCLPLGVKHADLKKYMNPYTEKNYDDNFANVDGSVKRNPKYSLDYYSSYNSYLTGMKEFNIYFCTASDMIAYVKNNEKLQELDDNLLLNGYLRKYLPLYQDDDKSYKTTISKKLEFNEYQRAIQDIEISEYPIDARPNTLIYRNRILDNALDIFKIFKEFELSDVVPYMRIQVDSYLDSYIKMNKECVNRTYKHDSSKTVTKELFERWNRSIYLPNGFTIPRPIDKTNSITFVIYDIKTTNYVTMILYSTGSCVVYCEKLMRIGVFTNKIISSFIEKCNKTIRKINNADYSYNNLKILNVLKIPSQINISYLYDISDYNIKILKKPFKNLSSEFLIIEEDENKPLHLLYCKSSDYENPQTSLNFISILKKKQLLDDNIIELLSQRYNISTKKAREDVDDWNRINLIKHIKIDEKQIDTSIIIDKVLDRIKVSIIGIPTLEILHELMKCINFIMGSYKEKRINKNNELSSDILQLFKGNTTKNILTHIKSAPEPEPEPEEEPALESEADLEPEPEPESSITEFYNDKDDNQSEPESDSESDSDSDSDDYDRIDSSDSQSGSGKAGSGKAGSGKAKGKAKGKAGKEDDDEDESKYPNKRYFIKRLEQRDPDLISYKARTPGGEYAKKCQAAQDKQPIVLTQAELDEIDNKTGFPNEGRSYMKPRRVDGPGRDDLFYICPKFWDRKHQIPLDPLEEYHPIEVDEEGNKTIKYRDFVFSREDKDNSNYILERTGRAANREDSDSYWNRNPSETNNIESYNVQFIQDDNHPDLLSLPCCGKKAAKIGHVGDGKVNVLIHGEQGPSWVLGYIPESEYIKNKGEKTEYKINEKDEYKVNVNGKLGMYHISLLKPARRGDTGLILDFPLKINSNGRINEILQDFFNMRRACPVLTAKRGKNGFYRKGIMQGPDAFLNSIDIIHCTNSNNPEITRPRPNLTKLKKRIMDDIKNPNFRLSSVAGGAFIQYFRSENIDVTSNVRKNIEMNVLDNFEKYLNTNEPNDEKLLLPLLREISQMPNNETFQGKKVNIIVFEEKNEKISIVEPVGKLKLIDDGYFGAIYKSDNKYEPMLYYYDDSIYGYLYDRVESESLIKGDDIIFQDTIASIISKTKTKYKIHIKDTDDKIEIDNVDIQKFNMKSIIDIIVDFIRKQNGKFSINKEIISAGPDLDKVMSEIGYEQLNNGYYDTYNRLSFIEYKEKKARGFKRVTLPIKPKSLSEYTLSKKDLPKPVKDIKGQSLLYVLKYLKNIDEKINELFEGKYLLYTENMKVIIDEGNKMMGLLLACGLVLPLDGKTYTKNCKLENLQRMSLIDIQNKYLVGSITADKVHDYYQKYNADNESLYSSFTSIYNEIRGNPLLIKEVNHILNHSIMVQIHKRIKLFRILRENSDSISDSALKKFIEYLLIHGLDEINKMFIHKFISLKEMKITNTSEKEIFYSMKDILNELYDSLFMKKSDFVRDISFYDEYNPNIQRKLLRTKLHKHHVSFTTKYPNLLNKLFSGHIKVLKDIVYGSSDINIISDIILHIPRLVSEQNIQEQLINRVKLNKQSWKNQNIVLYGSSEPANTLNVYKNNEELINDMGEPNYYLTLYDLKLLSGILNIGFVLFTNRYTNKYSRFETYIICNKKVIKQDLDVLPLDMICLYQDFDDENDDNDDKTFKPIEINEQNYTNLQILRKNTEFNRVLNKTFKL